MSGKSGRNIVYSTDPDWKPGAQKSAEPPAGLAGQTAHIRRETKGRGGKNVTVIYNLNGDLRGLLRELQRHCGSGGSVKKEQIEIQGDQRENVTEFLRARNIKVKLTGG